MDMDTTQHLGRWARWSRREFLAAGGAVVAAGVSGCRSPGVRTSSKSGVVSRKRLAMVGTEIRLHSHYQHFIDRFLEGYGWRGGWHRPQVELVAFHVDQRPEGDLSVERSKRFGVPLYPTIEEALMCGGRSLAVDGVVIVGEHGRYPKNGMGQTLYPRHAFFERVMRVFESSGRSVPVFQDKHLSTRWDEAVAQVHASRRLEFPYLAGSSLPVTWRIPSVEMPWGVDLEESVAVCYGGVDSYDFHGYETAQCMSERRRGGEVGIRAVQGFRGEALVAWLSGRTVTRQLMEAALLRSHSVAGMGSESVVRPDVNWLRRNASGILGVTVEHRDGFRTTMLLLNGLVRDFTYAGIEKASRRVHSCQMHLPMPGYVATTASFFSPLMNHVERMVIERRAPYPVERTLLTTGMTMAGVESLHAGGTRVETPEMRVVYEAPRESHHWRS